MLSLRKTLVADGEETTKSGQNLQGSATKSFPESKLLMLAQSSAADSLTHLRTECISCIADLLNLYHVRTTRESGTSAFKSLLFIKYRRDIA